MSTGQDEEQVSIWISFTDLMTSLALTFVLVMILVLSLFKETTTSHAESQEKINQVFSINQNITAALESGLAEFKSAGIEVTSSGTVVLKDVVLFELGKSQITPQGKKMLDIFVDRYFKIMLSSRFLSTLESIVIEGHTDPTGNFQSNLRLSQERAYNVVEYILDTSGKTMSKLDLEKTRIIQRLLAANGKSESIPIFKNQSDIRNRDVCLDDNFGACDWIDYDSSRRVVFRFSVDPEYYNMELNKQFSK